jgi:hypothetical protein
MKFKWVPTKVVLTAENGDVVGKIERKKRQGGNFYAYYYDRHGNKIPIAHCDGPDFELDCFLSLRAAKKAVIEAVKDRFK